MSSSGSRGAVSQVTVRVVAMADGHVLQVPLALVLQSPRLANAVVEPGADIESSSDEDEEEAPTIEVYGQSGPCLHAAFEFLHRHASTPYVPVPKPIVHNRFAHLGVSEIDQDFAASLGARKVSLEDLARAAEYLQLQDLLDLVTVKMATLIVGRTLDQAFDAFGFRHDPSDEANARVLAEYPWLLGPR